MPKVSWKANRVISIETKRKDENRKENVYVLAQMINRAQLLVFNLFSTDNEWENIDLSQSPILFCTYVTRQFVSNSNIYIQDIMPLKDYEPPKYRIDIIGICTREITVWEGTKDEKKLIMLGNGGGRLIEGDVSGRVIMPVVSYTDNATIDKYELMNVRIYPEFNERLYLCYKLGKNVDPLKDLVFNRQIPLEYKEYIDIISP